MISEACTPSLTQIMSMNIMDCVKMRLRFEEEETVMHPSDPSALHDSERDKRLMELIRRSQSGDMEAMEAIYEQFKQPIFNLICRYTYNAEVAEDLLQDTFIKVFTKISGLKYTDTFIGWMYRIAVNTSLSYLRSVKSEKQKTVSLTDLEPMVEDPADNEGSRDRKKPLEAAIKNLKGRMKSVFLLHDIQGFKHEEIAQILSCSVGTSKSQLFKARMKIRHWLARAHDLRGSG